MKTKTKVKARRSWDHVGVIAIDSGLCWIGDPCNAGEGIDLADVALGQVTSDAGTPVSVLVSTGPGDGFYDVFQRTTEDGTVLEVKVVFVRSAQRAAAGR